MLFRQTVFLLLSILLFLLFVFLFWDYSIDDAFITFRYAENLTNGYGLVFNPGGEMVEGYSNFLWLLILALFYKFGLSIYLVSKIIGLLSFLLTGLIWFVYFWDHKIKYLWLTGPLFLICPITAFWAVSGLELGLHALLLTGTLLLLLKRSVWIYLLLPLFILSRPEAVFIAVGIIITGAIYDQINKNLNKKYYLVALTIIAICATLLIIFRLQLFGYLFPNTFYAKTYHKAIWGYEAFGKMMLLFLPYSLAMLWWLFKSIKFRTGEKITVIFAVIFLMQAAISSSVDPVMNFLFRYMIPFLPLMLAISLAVISKTEKSYYRIALISLFVISLMVPLPKIYDCIDFEKDISKAQNKFIELSSTFPENSTISMTDMGRVPYYTSFYYNDLWGLLNKETAHDGFNPAREFRRLPDYFVLVGYLKENKLKLRFEREKAIARNKIFQEAYEFWTICFPEGKSPDNPGYYYMVFNRRPQVFE